MARKLPKEAIPFQFKPGQSGNPAGRAPNPIPNALRKLTAQQLTRIIKTVVKGNLDEIKRIAEDPLSSGLEVAIASCFAKAVSKGDYATVEHMLQRIVGKIPDKVEVTSRNFTASVTAEASKDQVKRIMAEVDKDV